MAANDDPCGTCQRPVGDHLVRELRECVTGTVLEFEELPKLVPFSIDDRDVPMADNIIARALVADTPLGKLPVVLLTFEASVAGPNGRQLAPITEVGLVLDPTHMRKAGTLVRDAAFTAANRAEAGQ